MFCSKSLLLSAQFRKIHKYLHITRILLYISRISQNNNSSIIKTESSKKIFHCVKKKQNYVYISEKNEASDKHSHRDKFITNTKYYAPNEKAILFDTTHSKSKWTRKQNVTDSGIYLIKANMILELVVLLTFRCMLNLVEY